MASLLLMTLGHGTANAGFTLQVRVLNAQSTRGTMIITLYDSAETFLERSLQKRFVGIDADGTAVAVFSDLERGDYAVTVIHDKNGNGYLDQGFLGRPKEPYAFSTGFRPRFRPPRFHEIKFPVQENSAIIEIRLP